LKEESPVGGRIEPRRAASYYLVMPAGSRMRAGRDSRSQGSQVSPNPNDVDSIKLRIAELQLEHRGLNQMIERMGQEPDTDQLLLRRLKKRKLQIKDSIVLLQMQLTPDVPA
jgi:hypothetical protein